jgi:hypothetical protein
VARLFDWRSEPGNRGRAPLGLLLASVSLLTGCSAVPHVSRGEALFSGQEAVKGRVRGHRSDLPPEVVSCRNCHATQQTRLTTSAAPHLDRSLLLTPRERRGGPPSAYDADTFCKLLRTGVDPVYILIAREMPVYAVDDAQCETLWHFLIGA